MKDELFNELLESVREGGTILRGEKSPSRTVTIEKTDVQQIRAAYRLSQNEFATLLGISLGTLRNWEQGRRAPQGPARVLLQIAARHPDAVWDVVQSGKSQLTNKKSTRKQKSL
jgi:putative transcriptional regulator